MNGSLRTVLDKTNQMDTLLGFSTSYYNSTHRTIWNYTTRFKFQYSLVTQKILENDFGIQFKKP